MELDSILGMETSRQLHLGQSIPSYPSDSTDNAKLSGHPTWVFSRDMYEQILPDLTETGETCLQRHLDPRFVDSDLINCNNLSPSRTLHTHATTYLDPQEAENLDADFESEKGQPYNVIFPQAPKPSPPACSMTRDATSTRKDVRATKASKPFRYRAGRERRGERRNKDLKQRGSGSVSSISQALSLIALEVPQVLVPDAFTFASRPVEVRHDEAAEAGKIKRPLNAFMLYRRSYQNVAKTRCTRNNHQQVSTICGESWTSLEPPDVVNKFNRLAGVEKQMHEKAFPNYKYDPILAKKPADEAVRIPGAGDITTGSSKRNLKRGPQLRSGGNISEVDECHRAGFGDHFETSASSGLNEILPTFREIHSPQTAKYIHDQLNITELHLIPRHGPFPQTIDEIREVNTINSNSSPTQNRLNPNLVRQNIVYEASIDPSLLPRASSGMHHVASGNLLLNVQGGWCCTMDQNLDGVTSLNVPNVDEEGPFNAYLRGDEQDWEVELLGGESSFKDWLSQTEVANIQH